MERGVDVDRVRQGFGVELFDYFLIVELRTIGASDRKGEEGVEVDRKESSEFSG